MELRDRLARKPCYIRRSDWRFQNADGENRVNECY